MNFADLVISVVIATLLVAFLLVATYARAAHVQYAPRIEDLTEELSYILDGRDRYMKLYEDLRNEPRVPMRPGDPNAESVWVLIKKRANCYGCPFLDADEEVCVALDDHINGRPLEGCPIHNPKPTQRGI